MPFKQLNADSWQQGLGRVLLVGPPNSRKTSSLFTWPGPWGYLAYPGELGYASVPAGLPGLHAFVWESDIATKTSPSALVAEVEKCSFELLAGKYGEITTFCGDGIHQLYTCYLNDATGGAVAAGEEFDPWCYGRAHDQLAHYISRVSSSKVKNVVFTCWDGREADQEGSKASPTHVFPDLPGKMAKRAMGLFSVVLYAEVTPPVAGQVPVATWQLKPGGKVWGAGVKVPPGLFEKLPAKVPQDWSKLEPLLLGKAN